MAGERKKVEPDNFERHTRNIKAWNKVKSWGLLPFLEKLHWSNQEATKHFKRNWDNGELTLYGRKVKLDENLIAKVTDLSAEGHNFSGIGFSLMKR